MSIPNKGLGLGDYTSQNGQLHIHGKCTCAIPGLMDSLKKCTTQECKDNIFQKLRECCTDNMLNDIISEYGPFNT